MIKRVREIFDRISLIFCYRRISSIVETVLKVPLFFEFFVQ